MLSRFMLRHLVLAAAVALTVGVSTAHAQYGYGGYAPPYYGSYGGGTVEGSIAHGYADIVRSAGAYNLMTSEAYKNYEDARRKNIENRLQWTQTYFEMRRINDEYRRAQYERDKRTQEDFIRYAQAAAPKRLSSSQLDPITGYLAWPRLLMLNQFADARRDLDKLYAERANSKGAIGTDNYFAILNVIEQMKERLHKLIKAAPTNDYIDAQKFLDSLAYEARFAAN